MIEIKNVLKPLIERVNRLDTRLTQQETMEMGAGGGGGSYSDEQAQDAVGNSLVDSATVDFTYNDAANTITAIVVNNSITNAKAAQMAANTVKSNITGATANAADNDIPTVLAQYIHAATSKTTPVDGDELPLIDSAASFVLAKLTWASLKATVATYYNTLAATLTNKVLASPGVTGVLSFNSGVAHENATTQIVTIADIGRFNVLNIDIAIATAGQTTVLDVEFIVSLTRAGNTAVWATARGWASVQGSTSGVMNLVAYDASFLSSGVAAGSVTAITGGVRISLSSSDFGNTLNQNMIWVKCVGFWADNVTVTVTIT